MKSDSLCLWMAAAALLVCCVLPAPAQESNAEKVVAPKQSQTFAGETAPEGATLAAEEAELRQKAGESPQSGDVLYRLGMVLRLERKYKESLETYTRAAGLRKPDVMDLRSVAFDYVQLNDYDDAIRWLRIALGMQPDNVDVLYALGRCFYTQNDFIHAEAAFTRVLQLKPDHLKAEENLGLTYDGQNKPELAEKTLRTAVLWADQRQVKDEWPYIDYASVLLDQSRWAEALPVLRKAVMIAPESAPGHEKLGRALLGSGQPAEAVVALEKAVSLDPQNPKAHFELGKAYRDSGQAGRGRAEFEISKRLYGTHNQE
ncbi:MAG TPA: tetratricopeptide repeat protein [Terracidiphilus sp.]